MRTPGRWPIFVAAACVAAATWGAACGDDDDGGGRGRPGELREITAEEYEKLIDVGDVPPGVRESEEGARREYRRAGSLSGVGDADSFEVYTEYDRVDVVFSWPERDADFWVKVFDEDGAELGDFDLDDGEVIRLLNGGTFTVRIYSREGGGAWSAEYDN